MSNINDFFHFADFWNFIWAHFCFRKNRAFRRSASYALHSRWSVPQTLPPCKQTLFSHTKNRLPTAPGNASGAATIPCAYFSHKLPGCPLQSPPSPQTLPSSPIPPSVIPTPAVLLNFTVIPNLIRDLYKITPNCCTTPKKPHGENLRFGYDLMQSSRESVFGYITRHCYGVWMQRKASAVAQKNVRGRGRKGWIGMTRLCILLLP